MISRNYLVAIPDGMVGPVRRPSKVTVVRAASRRAAAEQANIPPGRRAYVIEATETTLFERAQLAPLTEKDQPRPLTEKDQPQTTHDAPDGKSCGCP